MTNEESMKLWEKTISRVTSCCYEEFKNDRGDSFVGPALFVMGAGLMLRAGVEHEKLHTMLTKYAALIEEYAKRSAN